MNNEQDNTVIEMYDGDELLAVFPSEPVAAEALGLIFIDTGLQKYNIQRTLENVLAQDCETEPERVSAFGYSWRRRKAL